MYPQMYELVSAHTREPLTNDEVDYVAATIRDAMDAGTVRLFTGPMGVLAYGQVGEEDHPSEILVALLPNGTGVVTMPTAAEPESEAHWASI